MGRIRKVSIGKKFKTPGKKSVNWNKFQQQVQEQMPAETGDGPFHFTVGCPPYGSRINRHTGVREDDPYEQEVIKLIRQMRDQGFGPRPIARELTRRNVRTRRATGGWNGSTVFYILRRL